VFNSFDVRTFLNNIKYYATFQLIFVILVVGLSSIGAFFHFLLDHEISIVESWLHHNHWEILIIAKFISLFLLNRWFKVRLYQVKPFGHLVREFIHWPESKSLIVPIFMLISYMVLGQASLNTQNIGYFYFQITSFLGLFIFFATEFVLLAYMEEILNPEEKLDRNFIGLCYTLIFAVAFRLSLPDYYGLMPHVVLCYLFLIYVSGRELRNWSNVVCFLVLFVAPMGPLFGYDPVWGDDFSLFKFEHKPSLMYLAVVWLISFIYYNFRDRIIFSAQKLLR
jgi:hypothetical protein